MLTSFDWLDLERVLIFGLYDNGDIVVTVAEIAGMIVGIIGIVGIVFLLGLATVQKRKRSRRQKTDGKSAAIQSRRDTNIN
jgi:hypothetical protein